MESLLIFIKHRLSFFWSIIEWGNGIIFSLFYKTGLDQILDTVFEDFVNPPIIYRVLELSDTEKIYDLIDKQVEKDLEYFRPHEFDLDSISRQQKKRAFTMMGAFDGDEIVGYFFLRFFANRKCFVGRLIDEEYRGRGIGQVMNSLMYEIAWRMDFRCLSTISRNNISVIRAHAKNPNMIVIKELQSDYLLVEFLKESDKELI